MYSLKINCFITITLSFIIFTIVGTLSHEFGHLIVAKKLGYQTTLHFSSVSYVKSEEFDRLNSLYLKYQEEIKNKLPFPERKEFEERKNIFAKERLWITIGGPLQTILTGFLGFFFLIIRRRKIADIGMSLVDWFAVFFSLFWLRQVFNVCLSVSSALIYQKEHFFGGDEASIAKMLNLPTFSLLLFLGIIGLIISLSVIGKIIPEKMIKIFTLSGLAGGGIGFILWMKILGPFVLP